VIDRPKGDNPARVTFFALVTRIDAAAALRESKMGLAIDVSECRGPFHRETNRLVAASPSARTITQTHGICWNFRVDEYLGRCGALLACLTNMSVENPERPPLSTTRVTSPALALLRQIQNEYREMPGLILTEAQARRLWAADDKTCRTALTMLLERGFLKRTRIGAYVRAVD
jgi:hypothetical protein